MAIFNLLKEIITRKNENIMPPIIALTAILEKLFLMFSPASEGIEVNLSFELTHFSADLGSNEFTFINTEIGPEWDLNERLPSGPNSTLV
jgi:hypothetical protein